MRTPAFLSAVVGLAAAIPRPQQSPGSTAECAPVPSPYPTWQQLPQQGTLPDPFLPLTYMTTAGSGGASAADIMAGRGKNRVLTKDAWYKCQRPQLINMLQEYQFGYYPDPTQEKVEATRSGTTLNIAVTAGGKTGKFTATITLPTSGKSPYPVVINIGGMSNQPYLQAGIAVAQFNYVNVAPDSNAKTGAFWSIYNGRDIGVLTAWAWGFHRTLDAINMTVPEINANKVGVTGCSRLGKAALAAGLFDERITLSMPMSSGVQGMGPYRYYNMSGQGENLENSKSGAGWWSNSKLGTFVNHSENLPYDAHTIAAAIAPRAIVIDQGTGDQFVNSKATATVIYPAAQIVYDFLGASDNLAIAVRSGGHCDNSGYTNVLPYVRHILLGEALSKDYHSLGTYGSALASAYPWSATAPKASS